MQIRVNIFSQLPLSADNNTRARCPFEKTFSQPFRLQASSFKAERYTERRGDYNDTRVCGSNVRGTLRSGNQRGIWVDSEEDIPNSQRLTIDRYVPGSISVHSFHSRQSSMSSFRNHRVVIASLFLPTIAVIEESTPPTPEQPFGDNLNSTISAVTDRLVAANIVVDPISKSKPLKASINNHHRQPSASSTPLKSIVEDLKDKVCVIF